MKLIPLFFLLVFTVVLKKSYLSAFLCENLMLRITQLILIIVINYNILFLNKSHKPYNQIVILVSRSLLKNF